MKYQEKLVKEWNEKYFVGMPVIVFRDNGEALETTTRSEAQLLSGHTAVVWVKGLAGCYYLENVRPKTT